MEYKSEISYFHSPSDFKIIIDGSIMGGFSLKDFKPEDYDWVIGIVGRDLLQAYKDGINKGRNEVRNSIKTALGIQ